MTQLFRALNCEHRLRVEPPTTRRCLPTVGDDLDMSGEIPLVSTNLK